MNMNVFKNLPSKTMLSDNLNTLYDVICGQIEGKKYTIEENGKIYEIIDET